MTFEEGINEITSTFMDILNEAESYFGERDKSWTFTGIEFREDGPYIMYYPNKTISIVLSSNSSNNFIQLYYQLAHETCHLLYPTGKADANNLNEGISTIFSKIYQEKKYPSSTFAFDCIKKSKYFEAYSLVEELLSFDSEIIKKIRAINPNISYVTKDDLRKLGFNLRDELIDKLVQRF